MVFQNYALYPHMSVRKNMSYGLKLTTDLSAEETGERVEERPR
jgi:multiple sugar transport system ATP-binding protein